MIACLDQRSRPKIGNLILVGSLRIQTNAINLCIGREYRLRRNVRKIEINFIGCTHKMNDMKDFQRKQTLFYLPQIFRGASSSKRIGCCKNISRDFKHNPLTSFSVICTVLPGRLPLTKITNHER